ncbi:hypothetical protein TRFO_04179 [Tritrichomonas foetus]|uniref:Sfi1 spindle body domain-containing protein n=1 Tax=Tritrichomonas foetus TaxID=1144522 RepID=A0A1J4KIA7_9EUKA|nr:hypothetical protein TRFO_04179 [Tritrichomonas foetus]|eukprot:OHT10672.1 hypothetical protein TRFO_04179 [Tritrichomonas foetus]
MSDFSDTDLQFASHVELSDLGNSQMLASQKISATSQKQEIAASVNNRHRILSSVFREWRKASKQQKIDKVKKLAFKRFFVKKKIIFNFNKWKDRFSDFQRLHVLGDSLLIVKHFQLWKKIIDQQFEERKRFMRFLLKRRTIYEHQFFYEWKRSMSLVKKYKNAAKQNNKEIFVKALKAFRINILQNRQQQNLEESVVYVREKFLKINFFAKWKQKLRYKRLERTVIKRRLYQLQRKCFEKWTLQKKNNDRIKRKFRAVRSLSKKCMKRRMFNKWYSKYVIKDEMNNKIHEMNKMIRRRNYEIYFMKWLSKFNEKNYLSSSEQALQDAIKDIRLRRYFGRWHSIFDIIQRRNSRINKSESELRKRKLSRLFMHWRSQFAIQNFEKIMLRKAYRVMRVFYRKVYWNKWQISLKIHSEERLLNDSANQFRNLSLKLKAFNRIKIYYENQKLKQHKELIAQAHYVIHLERSAMISWKLSHRQTKRRFLMVSSVLRAWAYNVQKKRFDQWYSYIKRKKQKKLDIIEALEIHKRRSVSFALTSFVMSTKSMKPPPPIEVDISSDSSEDLLKSSFEIDEDDENNNPISYRTANLADYDGENMESFRNSNQNSYQNRIDENRNDGFNDIHYQLTSTKLPSPKRPAFLGPKQKIYPMQHMISMVNSPLDLQKMQDQLKQQIEETIGKLQQCTNEEERGQLNSQLKIYIDQANELLAQLP